MGRSGAIRRECNANTNDGLAGRIDERVLIEDFAVGLGAARGRKSVEFLGTMYRELEGLGGDTLGCR